jgi:hypothetical protein
MQYYSIPQYILVNYVRIMKLVRREYRIKAGCDEGRDKYS